MYMLPIVERSTRRGGKRQTKKGRVHAKRAERQIRQGQAIIKWNNESKEGPQRDVDQSRKTGKAAKSYNVNFKLS